MRGRDGPECRGSAGVVLVAGLLLAGAGALLSLGGGEGFPHDRHAGLFPVCLGCHAGIATGDPAAVYSVRPSECARCHDGEREPRVDWEGPPPRASNLDFSHPAHVDEAERHGEATECGTCHRVSEAAGRMEVTAASAERCLSCHAHEAPAHLAAETDCLTCHRTLVASGELSVGQVARFPAPSAHESPSFLFEHAGPARATPERCSVCHARESCTRCHLNADRLDVVRGLPRDDRVAALVADEPGEWPLPASHREPDWELAHGTPARASIESCSNCHAAESCTACHGGAATGVISELPRPGPGEPPGVRLAARRPPGHPPDFATRHGAAAATRLPECSTCHAESLCAECHDRPVSSGGRPDGGGSPGEGPGNGAGGAWAPEPDGGFHPVNFVLRHGAEAFAARSECSECHSGEAFCRSCHESMGIAATTRRSTGGAYHDAADAWLIQHGRAARQGLQECASCHRQSSCLRCHSARSGLRIDPHGPGFDPDRVADRSLMSCAVCHRADQILPPP